LSDRKDNSGIDRVGIGTDLHRLVPGRRLILGHVPIEYEHGLLGHSDGDVVLHAIIDAMAGAAGLPDIGEMYPDSDPAYKDVDSANLLEASIRAVRQRGYAIVNTDVTIHAERPKLSPHKPAIRQEVARLLGLPIDGVSIKAKTNEGVDAVGRGEAIACTAIVALRALRTDD
jgi:2-C-methyl-D-erythritol 2,4-cyclodiphosphate synthase